MRLLIVLLISLPALARPVAPLNPAILKAHSVFIENHGSANLADLAYGELRKWGRFEIAADPSKADLLFVISNEDPVSSSGRTKSYENGRWVYGREDSSTEGFSSLSIVDPVSGAIIYSDRHQYCWHGAIQVVIRNLRKRIDNR